MRKLIFLLLFTVITIPLSAQQQAFFSQGDWYQFSTDFDNSPGKVMRVTYNALQGSGIEPGALNPDKIQLFMMPPGLMDQSVDLSSGYPVKEMALKLYGCDDGSFDEGDYLLFYPVSQKQWEYHETDDFYTATTHPYQESVNYFLRTDAPDDGKRIEDLPSVEEEAQQTITTTDRLTGGPVFGGINVAERGADFVEQEITDSPCTYEIAREQDAEIVFSAVWKGTEEATLQVALNGSQLVSETLAATDAFVHKQAVFSAGTVMLQEGDVLTISYQGSDGDTNAEAYIDYMSLQAGEAIAATGLLFNAGQQQGQTVQWQGPWNQNTEIWNVTTPLNVVNQIKATENYFRTQTDDIQRFVAFDRSAGDGVEDFQGTLSPVEGQDLYAMETPQIFIITNANLAGRAEALAQRHRQDRRAATVVDVAQIYRNFSGDGTDFTAIRNFLAHHYQQSETLEYVTLFGDASVYPHDDRFIVPAYQSSGEWNEMMITAGDLFYGFLEDGEDFMLSEADMDIAVGRIPVATDAEAQDYLIKAEAYDHQGHWKTDFVMLADDKDNHIHMDTQENLATVLSEEVKVMNIHKIYF